jgi:hypothetical protein
MQQTTVNERGAAEFLNLSVSYLRQSRAAKARTEGPPFLKMGRSVRYDLDDLRQWRDAHRVVPTCVAIGVTAGADHADA